MMPITTYLSVMNYASYVTSQFVYVTSQFVRQLATSMEADLSYSASYRLICHQYPKVCDLRVPAMKKDILQSSYPNIPIVGSFGL